MIADGPPRARRALLDSTEGDSASAAGRLSPDVTDQPPAFRTAQEIARTAIGPRPIPPLAKTGRIRTPALARAVLATGLQVVAVRKPRSPLVEVRLRIPFGGTSKVHAARAEMLSATLLLGTGSRTREQVDADLALVGGHLDASVDPQRLSVTGSVLSTGLPVLLEVLADCLTDPAYRRNDVLGERDRLVAHLAIAATQPSIGGAPLPAAAAFRRPPGRLGHARCGAGRLGRGRPRCAGCTPAPCCRRVDAGAGRRPVPGQDDRRRGRGARRLGRPHAAAPPARSPPRRPSSAATCWPITGPARCSRSCGCPRPAVPRADPRYPAFQLANLVYGGYFSSRLVENIRESKGYTYSARSSLEFWPGTAAVTVAFDTTTESTAPALLEARYELGTTQPAAARPSRRWTPRRNYALGTLATSLSTQAGLASTLSVLAGSGLDETWLAEHPARLAALTVEEVADGGPRPAGARALHRNRRRRPGGAGARRCARWATCSSHDGATPRMTGRTGLRPFPASSADRLPAPGSASPSRRSPGAPPTGRRTCVTRTGWPRNGRRPGW